MITAGLIGANLFLSATALADETVKKTRKKSPAATTPDGKPDGTPVGTPVGTAPADSETTATATAEDSTSTGGKKKKKKVAFKKLRAGGIGLLATGMKDAPSPGVFGFGGAFGYSLSRSLEVEASLLSFGYILDYADYDTTVEISDMALGGDGIYRIPLSSSMSLRGRGGLGMHMMAAKVSGTLANSGEIKAESKNILAVNIGGGLELNFGSFYVAGDIRKPVLLGKLETVKGISIIACGEAGMRF
ncbi:hypothetical protein EBZ80_18895 [bacterium]|nr:hypothetical protein [bacterium]